MPKPLLIDLILVHLYIPARLPDAEAAAVRRTLRGPRFLGRLRQAVRAVFRPAAGAGEGPGHAHAVTVGSLSREEVAP